VEKVEKSPFSPGNGNADISVSRLDEGVEVVSKDAPRPGLRHTSDAAKFVGCNWRIRGLKILAGKL
jgi:hypothetical protein